MIDIRRAVPADAAGIAEVHCRSHAEAYRPIFGEAYAAPGVAQRTAHWRRRLEAGDALFVAIDTGGIVGFTHAVEEPDGRANMTTLYLLAAFHRRGIGRSLMSAILAHLAARGHQEAYIDCLSANARAIAFYTSHGAREISRHDSGPRAEVRFAISTSAAC